MTDDANADHGTTPAALRLNDQLGPVGWRYVPSEVWGDQVLTQDPKAAQLAREYGRDVEPLYVRPTPEAVAWAMAEEAGSDIEKVAACVGDEAQVRHEHE